MPEQEQFLHVLDRDEAKRRFSAALDLTPRGIDSVPLEAAARERFLALVARFPHVYSIKRGLRRFGPDELRAFLARESEQELDLLLAR